MTTTLAGRSRTTVDRVSLDGVVIHASVSLRRYHGLTASFCHLTYGNNVSAILLRPIREQFEHNRVIRILQSRLRRKFEVSVNLGDEREATGVPSGTGLVYPDLVLINSVGPRRLHGVVEVETAESVNYIEAMAEWAELGKVRGAFYLYVPAGATDAARRLCDDHRVPVTEIWSYHIIGDQMRFTMSYRSARASRAGAAAKRAAKIAKLAKAKRTSKRRTGPAKQVAKARKRTGKAAVRRAASARTSKRAAVSRAARPTPMKSVRKATNPAKTTRTAKKAATREKPGAPPVRKTASRSRASAAGKSAARSASKVRTGAGGAEAKRTRPSARSRKKR